MTIDNRNKRKVPCTADGLTREEFIAAMAPDCSNVEYRSNGGWVKTCCNIGEFQRHLSDYELPFFRIKPASPKPAMSWATIGAFVVCEGSWAEIIGDTVNARDEASYVVRWASGKEAAYPEARFQEKFRPGKLVPYDTMVKWIAAIKKYGTFVVCSKSFHYNNRPIVASLEGIYGVVRIPNTASVYIATSLCNEEIAVETFISHFRWADDNIPIGDVIGGNW